MSKHKKRTIPTVNHGRQGPGKMNVLAVLACFLGRVDDSELSMLLDKETTQGDTLEFGSSGAVD